MEPKRLPGNTPNLSAVVVGARTHRQGTGPFIAAGLAAAGANISGIVGTSRESVEAAQQELGENWNLATRGFVDLGAAIESLQPDAVAICSPWRVHAEQLSEVASAGRHCLVEKPLAWPASESAVDELINAFEKRGLLLQMVDQWPTTLPAFAELHGGIPTAVEQFTMRLSPTSIGPDMITDSAPHFIGMLQALAGPGECESCEINTSEEDEGEQQLRLDCGYRHGAGATRATLILRTQQERPRPAWYQINELRADREVELPGYQQYLACDGQRVALSDPLHQVAANFVQHLVAGDTTRGGVLRAAHRNLLQLAATWS